eukprot:g6444.t1
MPPRKGSKKRRVKKHSAPLPRGSEPQNLLELKTIYEGPGGPRSGKLMHKTTIIVTNRTVEIEREGANCCLSVLTLGCWFFLFQTASIEIYELQRITSLYLKDDTIIGEVERTRCGGGSFAIDTPANGEHSTKDLFFELKEAWNIARHGVLQDETEEAASAELDIGDSDSSDGELIIGN